MEQLAKWAGSADVLMAADGGADLLLKAGFIPHRTVGDFDSVSDAALRAGGLLVRDPNPAKTDCDKLLDLAFAAGHAAITLICAEGDLPDHVLAILHSALRSPLRVRIAYRQGIGWLVGAGASLSIPSTAGSRLSLLPLTESRGVSLAGVQWPFESRDLSATGFASVSNVATSSEIAVSVEEGGALLFVGYPPEGMPFW